MSAVTIHQMADRVAALMEERLHIRGKGLSDKLRRGGRALPRKVRAEAKVLAEAAFQAKNPKLLMQIDDGRVTAAYDICVKYLGPLNNWDRRKAMLLGVASSIAFSLLVVAGLTITVLVWRGLI